MKEYVGWLFDLYARKDGIVLWIVGEDQKPHSFTQPFQITFYVGGPFHRLRADCGSFCRRNLLRFPVHNGKICMKG